MITIQLDSIPETKTGLAGSQMEFLGRLLDRCEKEKIRDIELRIPAAASHGLECLLGPILERPFRFSAWFPTPPSIPVARLFIAAGQRITLATTVRQEGEALHTLLETHIYAEASPWQVSLFIALPVPVTDFEHALKRIPIRRGTNVTLGLGWATPEAGPSRFSALEAAEWAEVLPRVAHWWTEQRCHLQFACGLPLCMFSTEQLGDLALSRIRQPLAVCSPKLTVRLDGQARACTHLPESGWTRMPSDVPLRELRDRLVSSADFFRAFCDRANEHSCRSLATGACGGGCMAHNASLWQREGTGENPGERV